MSLEMSDEEIDAFLSSQKHLRLGTISENGWPHVTPVSYTRLDSSPVVYVHSHPAARKSRNIMHDNRVSAAIDHGESYSKLQGVFMHGYASVVRNSDRMEEIEESWKAKLHGGKRPEILKRVHARHGTTMWIEIEPVHLVTWDNTNIDPDRLAPLEPGETADFSYELPDDVGAAEPEGGY